jgi:hypothetical protein
MAKTTGLGWTTFSVDDSGGTPVVIKNDITDVAFATPRGIQDVTGLDKSAIERLLLLADFTLTPKGVFNASASHTVFSTVPSTSVARTVTIVVATATLPNETLFNDYKLTRSPKGELLWEAPGSLADGTVPTWS